MDQMSVPGGSFFTPLLFITIDNSFLMEYIVTTTDVATSVEASSSVVLSDVVTTDFT